MFPPEQFSEGVAYVEDLWLDRVQKTSDIWSKRPCWWLSWLFHPSIGTTDQLRALLHEAVDTERIRGSGIDVAVAAVDVLGGELVYYPLGGRQTVSYIMASSSYPLAFPPEDVDEKWLTDGGLREINPLGSVIAAGADRVLAVTTSDPNMVQRVEREDVSTLLPLGLRFHELMLNEILRNDVKMAALYNRLVDAGLGQGKKKVEVTVVSPSRPLGDPLDFSGELMRRQIEQGYEDAKALLS
jgi:predicted acylesterase/phospholipase RssA